MIPGDRPVLATVQPMRVAHDVLDVVHALVELGTLVKCASNRGELVVMVSGVMFERLLVALRSNCEFVASAPAEGAPLDRITLNPSSGTIVIRRLPEGPRKVGE